MQNTVLSRYIRKEITFDNDNDESLGNCADSCHGAWWYNKCHYTNLNGRYYNKPGTENSAGITWYQWKNNKYSFKKVEIKFR